MNTELRREALEVIRAKTHEDELQWHLNTDERRETFTAFHNGMPLSLRGGNNPALTVPQEGRDQNSVRLHEERTALVRIRQEAEQSARRLHDRQQKAISELGQTSAHCVRPIDLSHAVAQALADATAGGRVTWENRHTTMYHAAHVGDVEYRLFNHPRPVLVGMSNEGLVCEAGTSGKDPKNPVNRLLEAAH